MSKDIIPFVDLRIQYESLKKEIDDAIESVVKSSKFILGSEVDSFENEFAHYCGINHCIGVGNGTDALIIALRSLGIKEGDEVITVSHTFFATAEAIMQVGAEPVFVDIDPETYTMDVNLIEKAITSKTKAIIPVHLYGMPVKMDKVMDIAVTYNIKVIEDCAQAHGAEYRGCKVGTFGDAACFSFFPAKNLGCFGDGGAIIIKDADVAERARMLANHGRRSKYIHDIVGYNSRLDNLQAAILRVKLKYLDDWNEQRRTIAGLYNRKLASNGIKLPNEYGNEYKHVYHLYVIQLKNRDSIKEILENNNIRYGIHYPVPLHRQPVFNNHYKELPNTESVCDHIISIPIYPMMDESNAEKVISVIKKSTS